MTIYHGDFLISEWTSCLLASDQEYVHAESASKTFDWAASKTLSHFRLEKGYWVQSKEHGSRLNVVGYSLETRTDEN